jgi:phosphonopyruvate decarboxylase
MINPEKFFNLLRDNGIDFFTGVPDSLLKDICAYITDNVTKENNVIAANEGGAIALGAGYHLATGKLPLIYMQNSGIGNAINPLLSLVDTKVYSIPMLLMIGWRGEPGVKDEPQHIKQGEVTLKLLETMDIPYIEIPDDFSSAKVVIEKYIKLANSIKGPIAFVIRKNTFETYKLQNVVETNFDMTREDAIEIIVDSLNRDDIVVSTTGKTSRELFEYREKLDQGHENDFLTVGSMGHASQIALGISLQKPNSQVYCFDGDGSIIMHTGSLGIIGNLKPKNLKHIVFNNGAHDSVGGQPTIGFRVDFVKIAKAFQYKGFQKVTTKNELVTGFTQFKQLVGPCFLEVCINKGSRNDLGRPTSTPIENKIGLMEILTKSKI